MFHYTVIGYDKYVWLLHILYYIDTETIYQCCYTYKYHCYAQIVDNV